MQTAAWKVAPALACGCSVVLKPSELTPLNALRFAEICTEAGLPDGALTVVTGYGPTAGEALALHEDVDKISFTGSIATARKLLANSAVSNLKRLSLELGGKSPNIVFPDADFDAAVRAALWGIFGNKGEMCTAASRLLLHEDIYDRFLDELAARARKLRLGNPLDSATQMGPQISARQMDRILDFIEIGKQEGARIVCGGERDTEGDKARGYFVKPTIFADVTPDMRIAAEEIFGPVRLRHPLSRRRRRDTHRQRHHLRPGLRRLDARPQTGPPHGGGDQGRQRLGQHLQRLRFRFPVRRLQAERLRPRPGQLRAGAIHQREVRLDSALADGFRVTKVTISIPRLHP